MKTRPSSIRKGKLFIRVTSIRDQAEAEACLRAGADIVGPLLTTNVEKHGHLGAMTIDQSLEEFNSFQTQSRLCPFFYGPRGDMLGQWTKRISNEYLGFGLNPEFSKHERAIIQDHDLKTIQTVLDWGDGISEQILVNMLKRATREFTAYFELNLYNGYDSPLNMLKDEWPPSIENVNYVASKFPCLITLPFKKRDAETVLTDLRCIEGVCFYAESGGRKMHKIRNSTLIEDIPDRIREIRAAEEYLTE